MTVSGKLMRLGISMGHGPDGPPSGADQWSTVWTTLMIEIEHLRMEYGSTVAIDNLALNIPEGEVFGLIGPNGAGKTTLIRVLATLLEPTYGSVRVGGIDVLAHPLQVRPLIGYMSDFFSLYENMQAWEYLDHFARCYDLPAAERQRRIDQALELVSLEVRRDAEVRELSRGMRQRLSFAKSLLHEPRVLLLDEPASGLDPAGRIEFRELVKQLHAMGRTVLVSSHILTEMADFCTSIGIMEQGRLLRSGRVADILAELASARRLTIDVVGDAAPLIALLSGDERISGIKQNGTRVTCQWHASREALVELHRRVVAADVPLVSLACHDDNLEDIYMRISGHETA
ncbi:MAG: ABC transporter ATP-binding protein [Pirellulales bacterium]